MRRHVCKKTNPQSGACEPLHVSHGVDEFFLLLSPVDVNTERCKLMRDRMMRLIVGLKHAGERLVGLYVETLIVVSHVL